MKSYTVISSTGVTILSGILLLTDQQATPRAHCLDNLGDGLHEVIHPVQFKFGEVFGYDGEVGKLLLEEIAPVEETGRKKK